MIKDTTIARGVTGINQRSDRERDPLKLINTFVDVGILVQLENANNQIVYGRRGTGKTHILRVLESKLREEQNNIVVYIDARVLGSTSQFTDSRISIKQRCISLFRDMLGEIFNALQNHVINAPSESAEKALSALNDLDSVITNPVTTYQKGTIQSRNLRRTSDTFSAELSVSAKDGPAFKSGLGADEGVESESVRNLQMTEEDKIVIPVMSTYFRDVLKHANAQLYILLDEWSSLPTELQPYLAEFFKRGFLPIPEVVIKIGSLEYRSSFGIRKGTNIIGFELGSDVAAMLDVDDYYVYDRDPYVVTNQFGDILYKHLTAELPADYLKSKFGVYSAGKMVDKMFADLKAFEELARASEGIVRDSINIFTGAYFAAQRRGKKEIDKRSVTEAARRWFEQDKDRNLDDGLRAILKRVISEVVGNKKARSFLIPRELERNEMLQGLFEARVLHRIHRGYFDNDNPEIKYNIYTLDYGTYVDLLDTAKSPEGFFVFGEFLPKEAIVPFDDKRSIKRIVLSEDILKPTQK